MNGVMNPSVSAGSNQAGASDTWIAQVSCPLGPAARATVGAPAAATMPSAVPASTSRRVRHESPRAVTSDLSSEIDETILPAPFAPLTGALFRLYTRYAEYQRHLS